MGGTKGLMLKLTLPCEPVGLVSWQLLHRCYFSRNSARGDQGEDGCLATYNRELNQWQWKLYTRPVFPPGVVRCDGLKCR